MYLKFFGLRDRPFDLSPDPKYLVLTDSHREALSNVEYGIASRKGMTLLVGEAGTGKTTVIRSAIARQPDKVHCVHLHNPALTRGEFVEMLAARFELSAEAARSKATLLVELEALLSKRRAEGQVTVLIVDEAQSLPLELLEEIRLLANIETDETKLLPVVIAGQPELTTRLQQQELRQFKQRIALRCELRPLTLIETFGYVAGRIRAAGGVGADVFTREAVALLHERSRGIPRTVSVLADNALLGAFASGRKPIDTATVVEVCKDMDFEKGGVAEHDATPPAQMVAVGAADRTRVLAFDTSSSTTRVDTASPSPAEDASLFGTLYPKRRRFSLFRN